MADLAAVVEQLKELNQHLAEQNKLAEKMEKSVMGVKEEFAKENAILEEMNNLRVEEMKLRMARQPQ